MRAGVAQLRTDDGARSNAEIARALREFALRLEMEDAPFRPRAYEKAAFVVEATREPLSAILAAGGEKGLDALPGVGPGIARRIAELLRTGRMRDLERLRAKRPIDVLALTAIEGVGPKTAMALYEKLGVRDVAQLEAACRAQRVRSLAHFGERTERRILAGIALLAATPARHAFSEAAQLARRLAAQLRNVPGVTRVEIAGSLRRRKESIGDLDFLASASDPRALSEAFADLPEVVRVHARGEGKTLVRLANGMDADLRVVPAESFGAALIYFTGSKAHNLKLRRIAIEAGLKLNEYGLFDGNCCLASESEAAVYAALELPLIPPELREDAGEIEAARNGKLPRLIDYGALRGDLQVHTRWTDGSATIEEMAAAAQALGLEYIAITDHTRDLGFARGNDEARLLAQAAEIRALNRKLRGFRVLTGAEANIRDDGTLDIDDGVLAQLDVVGAAVHSSFRQSREQMTRRVLRAIENPHVDLLFHPTGRLIGSREPIDLDLTAVIGAAKRTGTVLEIDALPDRLDLRDEAAREALAAGVKLAIDSDAHSPEQLAGANDGGVGVARRAWARRRDVVNAWPVERCLAGLKDGKKRTRRAVAHSE